MNILVLAGAIGLWGGVHSWLASDGAKRAAASILGSRVGRSYRLVYNAFAALTFLPILWLVRALPDWILYQVDAPWRYVMLGAEGVAALLLLLTLLATDTLEFVGLRQIFEGKAKSGLVTGGFYKWVRHPLYLFGLIIIWLTPLMTFNMLIVISMLTVYLIVGAKLEEGKLLREFGAEYDAYRARTPMLIPGLRLGRTASAPARMAGPKNN